MSDTKHTGREGIHRTDIHAGDIDTHLEHINREFKDGFEFLRKFPKSVSIFGSSLAKKDDQTYKDAEALAARIAKELGYAIVTGGGPGIMEAANKGAFQAGGVSAGLNISLPHEKSVNEFTTYSIRFSYFFARKTMLTFAAEAYIFFPGGYGTMDELFSIMTLIQTGKIPHVPVILFGDGFWSSFSHFLKENMTERYRTIDPKQLKIFEITDSADRVIEIIKKAPVSEWWRNIN